MCHNSAIPTLFDNNSLPSLELKQFIEIPENIVRALKWNLYSTFFCCCSEIDFPNISLSCWLWYDGNISPLHFFAALLHINTKTFHEIQFNFICFLFALLRRLHPTAGCRHYRLLRGGGRANVPKCVNRAAAANASITFSRYAHKRGGEMRTRARVKVHRELECFLQFLLFIRPVFIRQYSMLHNVESWALMNSTANFYYQRAHEN